MNRIGFGMDLLGFEMYSEDFGCVLIVYLERSFSLGPYHCKKEAFGLQMDQADFGMNPIGFEIDLVGFQMYSVDFGMNLILVA